MFSNQLKLYLQNYFDVELQIFLKLLINDNIDHTFYFHYNSSFYGNNLYTKMFLTNTRKLSRIMKKN